MILLNLLLLATFLLWFCMAFLGLQVEKLSLGLFTLSIHDPGRPLLVFLVLLVLRGLLALEREKRLLLCGSLVFSLLVAEGVLRVLDHPLGRLTTLPGWHRPSAATSLEMVPGMSFTSHLGQVVRVNSDGLRDVERPRQKPPGQFRIAALGDSFTFGMGVPLEGTYEKRLQAKLRAGGLDVDVINGGIAGLHAFHAVRHFETKLVEYQPDLVTFGFFFDDVQGPYTEDELRTVYEGRRKAEEWERQAQEEKARTWKGRLQALLPRSFLVNFLRGAYQVVWLGRFRSFSQDHLGRSLEERHQGLAENVWSGWLAGKYEHLDRFFGVLRKMKHSVTSSGAKLVILLIPDAGQIGHPEWQVLNRQVADFCRVEDIPFIDMTRFFEASEDFRKLYLIPRDAHCSEAGHEVMGQALFEYLREQGLVPEGPSK